MKNILLHFNLLLSFLISGHSQQNNRLDLSWFLTRKTESFRKQRFLIHEDALRSSTWEIPVGSLYTGSARQMQRNISKTEGQRDTTVIQTVATAELDGLNTPNAEAINLWLTTIR